MHNPTVPPMILNSPRSTGGGTSTKVRRTRITDHSKPANYAEFFDRYWGYTVRLVCDLGISPEEAEDVASGILLKFFEKDVLEDFDPGWTAEFENDFRADKSGHGASFTTLLSGFVRIYVQHPRDMARKHRIREGVSTDMPVSAPSADGSTRMTWLEAHTEFHERDYIEDHSTVERLDTVRSIRQRLSQVEPRSAQDRCDLAALFEEMRRMLVVTGSVTNTALAQRFGVSATTIKVWRRRLQDELDGLL